METKDRAKENKTRSVYVRLTPSEHELFCELAQEGGETLAACIRRCALERLRQHTNGKNGKRGTPHEGAM